MIETCSLKTHRRNEMIDITSQVNGVVEKSGIETGLTVVYIPHTTAGVTINENADPDVVHDILLTLERLIPQHDPRFTHAEGNSDAHVKSSLVGPAVTIIVQNRKLLLGTWQGIYFCEFDGPRNRHFNIKVL
jgi:secondary thiamine-phosphate synthase enzyme